MRRFSEAGFNRTFENMVTDVRWQEDPGYYPRHRTRYAAVRRAGARGSG